MVLFMYVVSLLKIRTLSINLLVVLGLSFNIKYFKGMKLLVEERVTFCSNNYISTIFIITYLLLVLIITVKLIYFRKCPIRSINYV